MRVYLTSLVIVVVGGFAGYLTGAVLFPVAGYLVASAVGASLVVVAKAIKAL